MVDKNLKRFLPWFLLIFASLACATGGQVKLADIPGQEGWETAEVGDNSLVAAVIDDLNQTTDQEGIKAEYQIYRVPDGKTWEDAKTFYTRQFRSNWTEDKTLEISEEEKFNARGWTRGGVFSEQTVVIAWVEDKATGSKFLLVILFSE
mgnify:CR=1 FL=1